MLTRVVQRGDAGSGKYSATVNGTGLTGSRGNAAGPRSFSMLRCRASADRLSVEDASRHQRPGDLAGRGRSAQQHPDVLDLPGGIDAGRDGLDVQDRHRERVSSSATGQPGFGSGCEGNSW